MKRNNDFFQPVISVLGLTISLIVAILPLFKLETLTKLFIKPEFAQFASFITFILGIAMVWQITEFHPYPSLLLGKLKDRGKGFLEYWKVLNANKLVWLLITMAIIFGFLFVYSQPWPAGFAILQALFYSLFFLSLISIFSILFSETKQRFILTESKKNFPQAVFETLERNRLIKPGIEIYENSSLDAQELQAMGFKNVFIAKHIRVRTISQKQEVIDFVSSWDGEEILKVLSKGK